MTALTTRDAAERLRTTPDQVRHLIRAGLLRASVLNPAASKPTYRITPAQIRAYEQRCQR